MAGRKSFLTSRRLLIALGIFGLFIVFDIGLFGYLIFDSLSAREVEKLLLQTREEAEPLADTLHDRAEGLGNDLWVVMSVSEETRRYLDGVLEDRSMIRRIEVRDPNGAVVYSEEERPEVGSEPPALSPPATGSQGDGLPLPPGALPLQEVEVPIGELGTLVIGVSEQQLQERIAVLRGDLIRQASLIGVLTVLLLSVAAVAVWTLARRGQRLEEQALESERLAYIGTLASGLAHEIRNPLNSLSLNMQMLDEEAREGAIGGGSSGRLLAITRSEIHRLERLVSDFLSYAKPRDLDLEVVSPTDLFESVRSVLAGEIQARGARVEIEDRSDGAEARVDREQLRQVLLNVVQNALQATERVDRTPQVRLVARRSGSWVVLEVADNGSGMSEATRTKAFDIFYSTRKGGTGLGLAIVQRIAKAHDGKVEVESVEGQGTSVKIFLPRVGARSTTQTITLPVLDDRAP